jgi:hypothetical protein
MNLGKIDIGKKARKNRHWEKGTEKQVLEKGTRKKDWKKDIN